MRARLGSARRRRLTVLLTALAAPLLLFVLMSASPADAVILTDPSATTQHSVLRCSPSSRPLAVLDDGTLFASRGASDGVSLTAVPWDGTSSWSTSTIDEGTVPQASTGWALAAWGDRANGAVYVAENLSLHKKSLPSGKWSVSAFDSPVNLVQQGGSRHYVLANGDEAWVVYVYRDVTTYKLKLAWTLDAGARWSRVTLATAANEADLGGVVVPWIQSYRSGTETRATRVAALFREPRAGSWIRVRGIDAGSTTQVALGDIATNGTPSAPSAIADGQKAIHIVYDDAGGIEYASGTVLPSDGTFRWKSTLLRAAGTTVAADGCANSPSASVSIANDYPVAAYTTEVAGNRAIVYRARLDGTWSPEHGLPYPTEPSSVSSSGRPMLAEHGYEGAVPVEYAGLAKHDDGSETWAAVQDAIDAPLVVSAPSTEQTISPNDDGRADSLALTVTATEPVTGSLAVSDPTGAPLGVEPGACSGSTTLTCRWSGPPDPAHPGSHLPVGDGVYTAKVTVTDTGGWTRPITRTFRVDVTAPQATMTLGSPAADAAGWTATPTIVASAAGTDPSGLGSWLLSNDGTTFSSPSACSPIECPPHTWTVANGEGEKTVFAKVLDTVGNPSVISAKIKLDATAPIGTFSVDQPHGFVGKTATLHMTSTDPVSSGLSSGPSKIRFACGGPLASDAFVAPAATAQCATSGPDGARTFLYQVRDVAGNLSAAYTADVTRDATAPVPVLTAPATSSEPRFGVSWSAADVGSGVESYDLDVRRSDQDTWTPWFAGTTARAATYTGMDPYSYRLRLRARDVVGNVSEWVDIVTKIDFGDITVAQLAAVAEELLCSVSNFVNENLPDGAQGLIDLCEPPPLPIIKCIPLDGVHPPDTDLVHYEECFRQLGTAQRIAVISSGVDCDAFPLHISLHIDTCVDAFNARIQTTDEAGYGTWASSVLLQVAPNARITSYIVTDPDGTVSPVKLATALERVQDGKDDHNRETTIDTVLLAFPPGEVLDPISWAMSKPMQIPARHDATASLGSLWDVVNETITSHPYRTPEGTQVIGLPLDAGLRKSFFSTLEPRQAEAVETFSSRALVWARIRGVVRALTDGGIPVVAEAGTVADGGPTQAVLGVAALPDVITVGSSYIDADGNDRLSPVSARGPAPDLSLKPDLLAESRSVTGIVPSDSTLAVLADPSLEDAVWGGSGSDTVKVNAGWTLPAAAEAAATAGYYAFKEIGKERPATQAALIKGLLQTLASRHKALKPSGSVAAAPWEQGAGVLRSSLGGEPDEPAAPAMEDLSRYPIPLGGFDLGGIRAGGSKTSDVTFWAGGARPSEPALPSSVRFLGPNDGGVAVESVYTGRSDLSATAPDPLTMRLTADSGTGNADTFQGGLYCFNVTSGPYSWPACAQRLRTVTFRSSYLMVDQNPANDGERTEDETFILTPGLPAEVGPLGNAFKFVPIDPVFAPLGAKVTGNDGTVTFDNVPASFYRIVHFASYDVPGTYSDLDDPSRTSTERRANPLTDTWLFEKKLPGTTGWTERRKILPALTGHPSASRGVAMVYDSAAKRVLAFGGVNDDGRALSDLWSWNGIDWSKITPSSNWPSARTGAASAYDSKRHVFTIFGGTDLSGASLNDMWSWNGSAWTKIGDLLAGAPAARTGAVMVYDAARDRIVLHGGETSSGGRLELSDDKTWTWNPIAGIWTSAAGAPGARAGHGMAYDAARERTVLYGGRNDAGLLGDTWEYDGSSWTRPQLQANPPKGLAALTYVPNGGLGGPGTLMFEYTRGYVQTWMYDGAWRRLDRRGVTAPPSRAGGALAYDPDAQHVVLFGGLAPKPRTLGLLPGAMSASALIPARTVCLGDGSAGDVLGPLGVSSPLSGSDRNTSRCVDRQKLTEQWGGQVDGAASIRESGHSLCGITLTGTNGDSEEGVFCEAQTRFAVPLAVTTRYVDLIKGKDWDACGVPVDGPLGLDVNELVGKQSASGCKPEDTKTHWTFSNAGPNCDPDNGDGNITGTYSYTSTDALASPDLVLGILHYRFAIPSPNWYARLRLNLTYDSSNVAVAAIATTGTGNQVTPGSGALILPAEPQIKMKNGSLQTQSKRDTVTAELQLWPDGATVGDLYLVLTPTTWVSSAPPGLNAAKIELCRPSMELDTYTKKRPSWGGDDGGIDVDVDPLGDLFTRQIPLTGDGNPKSWMRYGRDPSAESGPAWLPFARESETVSVDYHVPRDWDPSVPRNAGMLAYPIGVTAAELMYDTDEGVTEGVVAPAAISPLLTNGEDIDRRLRDGTLVTDPWRVNGRFFGIVHVPDARVRARSSFPVIVRRTAEPSWDVQAQPWMGQGMGEGSSSLDPNYPSTNTRFPQVSFVNFAVPSMAATPTVGLVLTLDPDEGRLYADVAPPAGPRVTVDVNLRCGTSSAGTCPS